VGGSPAEGEAGPSAFCLVDEAGNSLVSVVLQPRQVLPRQIEQGHAGRQAPTWIDDPLVDAATEPTEVVKADLIQGMGWGIRRDPHLDTPAPH